MMPHKTMVPKQALQFASGIPGEFVLAGEDGDRPRFSMVANSGEVMLNHWYWGNLAIDLAGLKIGRQKKPALESHDTDKKVGWTDKISIDATKGLLAEGYFSQTTEEGQAALALAQEGFPWQASVYVKPTKIERIEAGESVEVNGHKLTGPGTVWRGGRLREVSLTALGVDENTDVKALSDGDMVELDGIELEDKTSDKESEMKLEDVTVKMLVEGREDIMTALAEASAEDTTKAISDAVTAERERVLTIIGTGAELKMGDQLLAHIKDGTEAATAVGAMKDKKLAELLAAQTKGAGANADPDEHDDTGSEKALTDMTDAELDVAFEASQELQDEFSRVGSLKAFVNAKRNGSARVFSGTRT